MSKKNRLRLVSGNGSDRLLPSVAAPWVEFEIFNSSRKDHDCDFTIRRPRVEGELSIKDFKPETAKDLIQAIANTYKKTTMAFRWVSNAILHARGIREVRPSEIYRRPALIALADTLRDHFAVVQTGVVTQCFRNPLRMLVEICYENLRIAGDDEIALLFFMLAEAAGIPSRYVIALPASSKDKGWRAFVECQLDMTSNWMAFDFGAKEDWGYVPPGTKYRTQAEAGPPEGKTVGLGGYFDNSVKGQFVIPQQLIGSGRLDQSSYWRQPKLHPYWFDMLNAAIVQQKADFNDPFIVNRYYRRGNVDIAENFGPEVTGAIIAKAARIYSQKHRAVFQSIAQDATQAFGVNLVSLDIENRSKMIADLVRGIFPYAEETVGVEELTTPLRMFWFYCFYPGVQKYDCDDLTTCFMTVAEAAAIRTKIRLAGDPGKTIKYHVYPVVMLADGRETIMDASSPTPWGSEMDRGKNFKDFEPQNPATYEPTFEELSKKIKKVSPPVPSLFAAGY